jgi:uncharacterized repeat protein (TIGR01451 family)
MFSSWLESGAALRGRTLRRCVAGLLAGTALAAAAPAAVAQNPPPPIEYEQIPLHAGREHASGAADDARIERLLTRRKGGNVAVFVYRRTAGGPLHSIAMDSLPLFWRVPEGITKGHAEERILDFLERAGIDPEWVIDGYSEREPCIRQPHSCKTRIVTRNIFPNLEKFSYSLPHGTPQESSAGTRALVAHNTQLLKEWDQARNILNPGGRGGTGALPLNLARPLGPGGIDFSTLELRHVADTDRSGIRYSFRGLPTSGTSDPAVGLQTAQQASNAFFTWLAVPPQSHWVNLNPNEPDRIIDPQFGRTDAGRVLLEADLAMKKSFARAMHPDTPTGAAFWQEFDNLYENRPDGAYCWSFRQEILPAPATVRETGGELYILDAPLRIDATAQHFPGYTPCSEQEALDPRKQEMYRRLIVPEVERAINTAPEYAALRRVYLSRVAAEWFRQRSAQHRTAVSDIVDSGSVDPWALNPPWNPRPVFDEMVRSLTQSEFVVPREKRTGDVAWTRVYSAGGVNFGRLEPGRKVSAREFKAGWPKLARQVKRAQREPAAVGNEVWVGGADAASATTGGGVRLRMTAPRGPLRVGQLVRFRLDVTNPTDVTARDVRVCDRLPAELAFVRSSDRRRLREGRHCWDVELLAAEGTRRLGLTARVLAGAGGRAVNTATGSVSGSTATARARRMVQVVGGGSAGRPGGVTG